MAERSQGPVKPPTIDLVARETAGGQPSAPEMTPIGAPQPAPDPATPAVAETAAEEPAKKPRVRKPKPTDAELLAARAGTMDPPPEPPPQAVPLEPTPAPGPDAGGRDWSAIAISAVVGALLGAALVYLIGTVVPLPSHGPGFDDPTAALGDQGAQIDSLAQQLSEQTAQMSALTARLASVEKSTTNAQSSLDMTITQIDSGFADVKQQLDAVKGATPTAIDAAGFDARLRELAARVDAVAAGASSADAGALAQNLNHIESELATLHKEVTAFGARVDAADSGLGDLRTGVAALEARMASAPALPPAPTIGDVALTGLEAALAAARPFTAELTALTRTSPGLAVPPAIAAAARTGLPSPDELADRFTRSVPDMLAARPTASGGSWEQGTVDWLKGLLAIRPAGDVEGDSPEAVLARLEAAMARRDFAGATALFAQLPAEMQAAAGTLPADVALEADAAAWIASLHGTTEAGGAAQ